MSTVAAMIPIKATEQIVDALNSAAELEEGAQARIEFLLKRLQAILDRECRCAVWLVDELRRKPAPHIVNRCVLRPPGDDSPLGADSLAQEAFDAAHPISRALVPQILHSFRTPFTMIASQAATESWFEKVLVSQYLNQIGCADCIASFWAASEDRAIILLFYRRDCDREFTEKDQTLVSLMHRAMAPIVDREMFRRGGAVAERPNLSKREREVLLMLLGGDSEKEVAANLHRSVHTVHTFVRKLYEVFEVSSRGELMALFIDKAVFERLEA